MRLRWLLGIALVLVCAVGIATGTQGARVPGALEKHPGPDVPQRGLAKGRFLVATRQIAGPTFHQSVVLLLDYGPEGALGLIINKPTATGLGELFPQIEALGKREDRAWFGGPVDRHQMMLLIRSDREPARSRQVLEDVYLSSSLDTLQTVASSRSQDLRFRAYVGYAGWAPRQLDFEVARGDWHVIPAEADRVFAADPEAMWLELIERSGGLEARSAAGPARF